MWRRVSECAVAGAKVRVRVCIFARYVYLPVRVCVFCVRRTPTVCVKQDQVNASE